MSDVPVSAHGPAGPRARGRLDQFASAASWAFPAFALAAGAVFVALELNHGWVPLDDGTLAQSAQRVLDGELPHRDFAELYTGGLSFLNAGVFWLAGNNLFWLRVPMFLLFLAYLPCVYLIARRFASPAVATLAGLFAVAWGPPVYPAAMPSWYTLFLAVIGAYFLLRHHESDARGWLFAAGLVGGLSLCCKITGVWYVLAVVVYLVYRAAGRLRSAETRHDEPAGLVSTLVLVAVPVLLTLVVVAVLAEKLGSAEAINLLLPVASVCASTVWVVLRTRRHGAGSFAPFCRSLLLFSVGVAVPPAALAVPYALTDSLGDLYTGVFVTPRGRLESGYYGTTAPAAVVFAIAAVVVLLAVRKDTRRARRIDIMAGAVVGALLVLSAATLAGYLTMWYTTTSLLPVGVVLGAVLLARMRPAAAAHPAGESYLFLLLALAAFVGLVQFPFGAPVYFCFVAPLAVLAWLAMFRHTSLRASVRRIFPVALLVGIVGFGFVVNHSVLYRDGTDPNGNPQTVVLDRDRAWIRVRPSQRAVYREVMALLRAHARGSYVYAGPDTPEIYALTGLRNPTRSLFDVLDPSNSARGLQLLRTLDQRHVTAIAINPDPAFSDPLGRDDVARLRSGYPHHQRVGQFEIRWKPARAVP